MFGAWLAKLCGVDSLPESQENIRANLHGHLRATTSAPRLWEHANPQRPGYAMGDEPGLLLCTWPRGGKPTLPFVYSDEVWTGIEYQAASHLIAEGLVDEGLTIVKALRSALRRARAQPVERIRVRQLLRPRHGQLRPAHRALRLPLLTPRARPSTLAPRLSARPFQCFFSTASAWGTITLEEAAAANG